MLRDCLGNPLSDPDHSMGPVIDSFIEGYLGYDTRAERILEAADGAPQSCLANVYAGLLWMLLEAPEGARRAAHYRAAAQCTAAAATRREQLNVAVLGAWVDDDLALTLRLCDQISDEFPRDLVIMKLHQYLEFNRGNAAAMLRVALKVQDHNAHIPHMHGMTAFAYEQCHLLDEAERAANLALRLSRKEPWAQHALAHVALTRGRIAEGAQFLESVADTWVGLNSFMLTHLWWHLALLYLSQGREHKVLELYDGHCWGVAKNYSQDQVGAVSLLARFEMAGIDVGARWQDLAKYLAPRAHDTVLPFLTLQYVYGLARAGRPEADALLESVRAHSETAPLFVRETWRQVALPACEGLSAYAHGDYQRAWTLLSSVMPRLAEIGGSHAQRDLFEQVLLDSAVQSGGWSSAQQMLEKRRSSDPAGVPVNLGLAQAYARLGLPSLSAQCAARAAATRSQYPD